MNLIKQIIISILLVLGVVICSAQVATAQENDRLLMVVTEYQAKQNLDFFFLNSTYPLKFIEPSYPEDNAVFLSVVTPEQKVAYEKAGYNPVVIDENVGSINDYYISQSLTHRIENLAVSVQKPEYKANGLEMAYQLTKYTALFKVAPDTTFSKLNIPELEYVNAKAFSWNLVPPPNRTSAEVQALLPFEPELKPFTGGEKSINQVNTSDETESNVPLLIIGSAVITVIILFIIFRRKKDSSE